jgi:hypothetical protein
VTSVEFCRVQNPHPSARTSVWRLTLRAAFIVIVALSIGLWWAVWEAICSLGWFGSAQRVGWISILVMLLPGFKR